MKERETTHCLSEDWESSLSRLGLHKILTNSLIIDHDEVLREVRGQLNTLIFDLDIRLDSKMVASPQTCI